MLDPTLCPRCGTSIQDSPGTTCPSCQETRTDSPAIDTGAPNVALASSPASQETSATPVPAPPKQKPNPRVSLQKWQKEWKDYAPYCYITLLIIMINLGVFMVMLLARAKPYQPTLETLVRWGASFGPLTTGNEWWRVVTAQFLHADGYHLLLNMLCFLAIGRDTERMLGRWAFLVMYLTSGIFGSLSSVIWEPEVVAVGSSGAIFGTFGAYFAVLIRSKGTIPRDVFRLKFRMAGQIFLINFIAGFFIANIDVAAHTGGFLSGLVLGYLLGMPIRREASPRPWQRTVLVPILLIPLAILGFHLGHLRSAPLTATQPVLLEIDLEEARVLELFNRGFNNLDTRRITPLQFAQLMQSEIIPPWKSMQKRLAALPQLENPEGKRMLARYKQYLAVRLQSFEDLLIALQTNEPSKFLAAKKSLDYANWFAKSLHDDMSAEK